MTRDRLFRREQAEKKKAMVKRMFESWVNPPDPDDPRMVGLYANTPRPCSHPCCSRGNCKIAKYGTNKKAIQHELELSA